MKPPANFMLYAAAEFISKGIIYLLLIKGKTSVKPRISVTSNMTNTMSAAPTIVPTALPPAGSWSILDAMFSTSSSVRQSMRSLASLELTPQVAKVFWTSERSRNIFIRLRERSCWFCFKILPVSIIAARAGTEIMLKMLKAIMTGIAMVFLFFINECIAFLSP